MVYMYHSFLIHSSADGHLGCLHVLVIINSAAKNIEGARVSFRSGFLSVYVWQVLFLLFCHLCLLICKNVLHFWNSYILQEHVSVQLSLMSNSLWPNGLQHARHPCPSPIPGACSNSCPSSQWCHPAISSSAVPFSFLQSFPTSGSFLLSQFFESGG